jgi:hypothetical protein
MSAAHRPLLPSGVELERIRQLPRGVLGGRMTLSSIRYGGVGCQDGSDACKSDREGGL